MNGSAQESDHRRKRTPFCVQDLVEDARLVLLYAVRSGQLQDEALPNAIAEFEATDADVRSPAWVHLSKALNDVVVRIAPVTIVDLREGRSPFDENASPRSTRYFLCAMAAMLAGLIAFYSFALLRGEAALREYHEVRQTPVAEKIGGLRQLVQQDNVLQKRGALYEQFLRDVRELKDLQARRTAAFAMLTNLRADPAWPFQQELLQAVSWGRTQLFGPPDSASASSDPSVEDLPFGNDNTFPPCPADEALNARETPVQLASKGGSTTGASESVVGGWPWDLAKENLDEYCFLKALNLDQRFGNVNYLSLSEDAVVVRDRNALVSAWVLPFVSGLLGAVVFLLRDLMSTYTPSFAAPRVLVRLSIGGVAGIIIGWFWAPAGLLAEELPKTSSVPLALAFLAGYSIDILFSALERVRSSVIAAQEPAKVTEGGR